MTTDGTRLLSYYLLPTTYYLLTTVFREAGIIRVASIEELFNSAIMLTHQPLPKGDRCSRTHCAAGRGRSATVVAALLLVRGQASSAKEALAIVRRARRGVRLIPAQYRLLESIVDSQAT